MDKTESSTRYNSEECINNEFRMFQSIIIFSLPVKHRTLHFIALFADIQHILEAFISGKKLQSISLTSE